jgi:ATP-binding cassette, subfamily B, bacterial
MTGLPTRIELPEYGHEPPFEGTALDWWRFFTRPHWRKLALYFSINLLRASFFRAEPAFFGLLIALFESGRAYKSPELLLYWLAAFVLASLIIFSLLIVAVPMGRLMDLISKQISLYGFRHYLDLSEGWHESNASGEKLQRLLSARRTSFDLIETFFWHIIQIPAIAIAVTFSMAVMSAPFYYSILFCLMVGTYMLASQKTGHWMSERYRDYNETLEKVIGGVYEFIVSTATVRFFNLKGHIIESGQRLEVANHESRARIYQAVFKRWFLLDTVALAWGLGIVSLAAWETLHGKLSVASLATISFLSLTIWFEIENIAIVYTKLLEQWEGFKRLTDVLGKRPTITDAPGAVALKAQSTNISFKNLNFGYAGTSAALKDFSLDIKAGEKIGLLGRSGAGKTTLVKMLLRFYDADSGKIEISGQDIRTVTLSSLQQAIAVIPQDVALFNHPLMENIRYGRMDAADEEVIEAAKKAHAHAFVQELPDGYRTLVGERGVKLSGGQRQRVAIARAILKNAPILVLDEATSALDSESEKLIQESLKDLMKDKTVIAIAHRLSTISHLDRLIVMDRGAIVEEGSHGELLAGGGLYARLWAMQSGGFLGE